MKSWVWLPARVFKIGTELLLLMFLKRITNLIPFRNKVLATYRLHFRMAKDLKLCSTNVVPKLKVANLPVGYHFKKERERERTGTDYCPRKLKIHAKDCKHYSSPASISKRRLVAWSKYPLCFGYSKRMDLQPTYPTLDKEHWSRNQPRT
jgi:hypothetical protein